MTQTQSIIFELCKFSPRQGENEQKSAQLIKGFLNKTNISYQIQPFSTQIPIITKAELFLDNKSISCLGSCFNGGTITSQTQVEFGEVSDYVETINFTDNPSVRISRINKDQLQNATKISGQVVVEKFSFQSQNIMVGNLANPQKIVFTHYDSLGGGAIDNAGGVAVCIQLLTDNVSLLVDNLFVFAGNEELSYETPDYWGKGYREFENQYSNLLESTKEIIIVDGIGVTNPVIIKEDLDEVFPVKNLLNLSPKITWISSDQSEVLKCYHCAEDTPDKLNLKFLEESQSLLHLKLQN